MEHNEQLIEIINELNAREKKNLEQNRAQKRVLSKKINTVENIVEELPEESDVLKSYLSKFKKFKSVIDENKSDSLTQKTEEENSDFEDQLESYSKSDARVFTNKAKKKSDGEAKMNSSRLVKYSNAKASLTDDSRMSPLRLDRYNSH